MRIGWSVYPCFTTEEMPSIYFLLKSSLYPWKLYLLSCMFFIHKGRALYSSVPQSPQWFSFDYVPYTQGNETIVHTYFLVFLYWKRAGFFICSGVKFCSDLETFTAAASVWCLSLRILLQRHPITEIRSSGMWDIANSVLHHLQTLQESLEHQWTKCCSAWWQMKKITSGVRKKTSQVCRVLHAVASPGTLISVCGILPLGVKRPSMLCVYGAAYLLWESERENWVVWTNSDPTEMGA